MTYARDVNVQALAAAFGADVGAVENDIAVIQPNVRKITTDAGRAPLPTDDETQGHGIGARWLWQGQEWILGDAGWVRTSNATSPDMFAGDDTAAINAAISADLMRVDLGAGAYSVTTTGGVPTDGALNPTTPVLIEGSGAVLQSTTPNNNILMRYGAAPTDAPPEIVGGSVSGVMFDGGFDASDTATHASWTDKQAMNLWAAGVKDWSLRDVKSINSPDYGIGLQTGRQQRIRLRDVVIENTMNDAIDQKNNWSRNADNSIHGLWAERFGIGTNPGVNKYAGIDLMSPHTIASHVWATDWGHMGSATTGIRFKQGEVGDAQGRGGFKGVLYGFHVRANQGGEPDTIGVDARHRNVTVALGSVFGAQHSGVRFVQENGVAVGLDLAGTGTAGGGLRTQDSTYASNGDYAVSAAVRARSFEAGLHLGSDGGMHMGAHLRGNVRAVAASGNDNAVLAWSAENGATPVIDTGLRNWVGLWEAGTLNVYRAGVRRYSFGDIIESRSPASSLVGRLSATDNAAWMETKTPSSSTGFWVYDTNGAYEWQQAGAVKVRLTGTFFNVRVPINLQPQTVSSIDGLTKTAGAVVYCSNGDAGQPCLAVCDGTNWRRVSLGAAISAT